jgi:hypothetical protein
LLALGGRGDIFLDLRTKVPVGHSWLDRGAIVTPFRKSSLGTRMLQGVALSFWLTLFWYLLRAGSSRRLSMRAAALLLLTVGTAGAAGGGAYHATDRLRAGGGIRAMIANTITVAAYCVVAFAMLALVAHWL